MIFHKTLLRELASSALATFLVLLGIVLTTQLVRLLGQAATGEITTTSVVALLGFTALSYLPTLLSLTMFIAVLMSVSRAYRDSEMVVWFSCGVSLTRWISPVMKFVLPLAVATAVLALGLTPWAAGKAEDFRKILDGRDDASTLSPGVFREARHAQRVYFVEEVSGHENLVGNIFISSTQQGKSGVMVAKRGYQEIHENGDRFLVMLKGSRYEGEPGTADFKVYQFERYAIRTESAVALRAPITKTLPTMELLITPSDRNLGELAWRLGLCFSTLILPLLAIPLAFVNPRAGRSVNLLVALFVYMSYTNLLSVMQMSVAQSRVSWPVGFFALPAGMLLLLALLFYRRMHLFSFSRVFR